LRRTDRLGPLARAAATSTATTSDPIGRSTQSQTVRIGSEVPGAGAAPSRKVETPTTTPARPEPFPHTGPLPKAGVRRTASRDSEIKCDCSTPRCLIIDQQLRRSPWVDHLTCANDGVSNRVSDA